MNKQLEPFLARILITTDDHEIYMYNREAFNTLNIKQPPKDDSQFICIGDILTIRGNEYKVTNINFKLYPHIYEMSENEPGLRGDTPTPSSDYNCQIYLTAEKIKAY